MYLYVRRDLLFPLVRRNINHFTDVIWERRKELKLCSNRPLKWTGDSCPEIKIQVEIDLFLLA